MTDSAAQQPTLDEYESQQIDAVAENLEDSVQARTQWDQEQTAKQEQRKQAIEEEKATNEQYAAEQADPRNKENWGVGGVVKELQSAFGGGIQDTASSVATVGERIIDTATGEMQEETKDGGKYTAEWDDWFVDDSNPIETKTWWGGLIRSATHFGTLGGAIVLAAPKAAVVGTALGAGRAITFASGLVANQWARAAAVGVASDLVSKYSQDANGLQILRDRYGFIDTPLTTNDTDHPTVKTFKNVVEGAGIGELANGLFRVLGKARNAAGPAIEKGFKRAKSVTDQVVEKGKAELVETPKEFRGHKNKPVADPWQGSPTSKDSPVEVQQAQQRIRNEWGAEDGSPGSVTTPNQLDRVVKTSGMSGKLVDEVYKSLVSDAQYQATIKAVTNARTTLKEVAGDAMEQFQQTGLGREAADLSPEEYLAEYFEGAHRYFEGTPDEMVAWTSRNVVAGDLLAGSLLREIRDLGIVGRELGDIADLASVDGPGKALFDKLIAVVTETKRSRLIQSDQFRELGARFDDPRTLRAQQTGFIRNNLESEVQNSIDGFRLAFKIAGESDDDDLFKAIFEVVSQSNDIHNIKDFDAWVRRKLKGGEFNGKVQTGVLIRELQGVMVNSILSGPKTPARAIMGTSTATFLRPVSQTVGAALRYPFTGDAATLRSSMASVNAMRESIPEAFELFKRRLNSYWAGDIATVKSRFSEYSKGDEQWGVFADWVENSGQATLGDRAAFYMANLARGLNDNKFLTYSTKIMAATDDTFGYVLARARAKEKAVRQALDNANPGRTTDIDPKVLRDAENRFLDQILDADGNIIDDFVLAAKKEATLTTDLRGFSKGLNDLMVRQPWTKPFMLFARTGINGLTLTAKHTPGFNFLVKEFNEIARASVDDLSNVTKYGINSPEDLMNAKALQQGRLVVGGSVISMASMHFMNGGLTGNGPTDRQKRQVWIDAGWQPRSINIGGVWVGYDSMEPFNQILSTIADIGDHSQLMGEEWTENQFQKLSLVVAQAAVSKSYLQGLQQMVDLFAGRPGQQNRVIAGLLNNTVPLAGLRNEIGKLFNPHMKELGSGINNAVRNRNLLTEGIAGSPLPTKYDMLNGKPIRDHDFVTRMWNMFIPIPLNLDQGPGRKLLFESGYDLRMSTYYGPDGTDLTDQPELRSQYQQRIGNQNLELQLNKLADDPKIQASIAEMQRDLRTGNRDREPMKAYYHNKKIQQLFNQARRIAWAEMMQLGEVKRLMDEERLKKIENQRSLRETAQPLLQMNK